MEELLSSSGPAAIACIIVMIIMLKTLQWIVGQFISSLKSITQTNAETAEKCHEVHLESTRALNTNSEVLSLVKEAMDRHSRAMEEFNKHQTSRESERHERRPNGNRT